MIIARDFGDMIDMVGDLRHRSHGFGMRLHPCLDRGVQFRLRMASEHSRRTRFFGVAVGRPFPDRLIHIIGREIDHHHAAVLRHSGEHRVAHIARMAVDRLRTRVREDDGRLRYIEGIHHRHFADVTEIDQHADAIHLADDAFAVGGEAVMLRDVRGGIGPVRGLEVSERHIAGAEIVEHAQRGEAVPHLMTALDPDEGCDAASLVDPDEIARAIGLFEIVRISGDEAFHDVDLFERIADGAIAVDLGGNEHRPELPADPALMKPGHVGHEGGFPFVGAAGEAFGPTLVILTQLLGEVIVPVDERGGLQDAVDPCLHLRIDGLGTRCRGEQHGGKGEGECGFHEPGCRKRGRDRQSGDLSFGVRPSMKRKMSDLEETMAFDPDEGIADLDTHLDRLNNAAEAQGFKFDRHAARNELQAATFGKRKRATARLVLSPSGAMAIEVRSA